MKILKIAGWALLATALFFLIYQKIFSGSNSAPEIAATSYSSGQVGLNIGDYAPEMEFLSPEGEKIPLSSLRGTMVMIDFWASWCGPCRASNPSKVAAWQQFKNKDFVNGKGFTLYSVSLDNSKDAWVKGIADDGLDWPVHVSDLEGWNSAAAALYQVRSIPASFLIDGNGVIVARNLRGNLIAETLTELVSE